MIFEHPDVDWLFLSFDSSVQVLTDPRPVTMLMHAANVRDRIRCQSERTYNYPVLFEHELIVNQFRTSFIPFSSLVFVRIETNTNGWLSLKCRQFPLISRRHNHIVVIRRHRPALYQSYWTEQRTESWFQTSIRQPSTKKTNYEAYLYVWREEQRCSWFRRLCFCYKQIVWYLVQQLVVRHRINSSLDGVSLLSISCCVLRMIFARILSSVRTTESFLFSCLLNQR